MHLVCVATDHPDFRALTAKLDAELTDRYGPGQKAYDIHNRIAPIATAMVGYMDDRPVACGCFKRIDDATIEIKRMFVEGTCRGTGHGRMLLQALEAWGAGMGCRRAILETGKGQPEAIALYRKCGYRRIENYGPYEGMENSVCFAKAIGPGREDGGSGFLPRGDIAKPPRLI